MARPAPRSGVSSALCAVAAILAMPTSALAQRSVSPEQKQAYIDAAKEHNRRDAARDAEFYAHQDRLHDRLAAARKAQNWAEVKRLQGLQAQDQQHLVRERAEDQQNQAHIKRVYGLKTK